MRTAPGVALVLTAKDVPGKNDVSPFAGDDPMFADGLVQYYGQSLFAVAADTMAQARAAARLAVVEYEDRPRDPHHRPGDGGEIPAGAALYHAAG